MYTFNGAKKLYLTELEAAIDAEKFLEDKIKYELINIFTSFTHKDEDGLITFTGNPEILIQKVNEVKNIKAPEVLMCIQKEDWRKITGF